MRSANSRYNLMQVRSNRRHWCPAKAIIGAALDDDDVERSAEQPVEATQQSGRGLPAHTGVHDLEREARRVDLLLNQLGIRAIRFQAQPRRETGADKYHRVRSRGCNRL